MLKKVLLKKKKSNRKKSKRKKSKLLIKRVSKLPSLNHLKAIVKQSNRVLGSINKLTLLQIMKVRKKRKRKLLRKKKWL